MPRGQSEYNRFVTKELRKAKPRTRADAQQALKRAAAEWRAMKRGVPVYPNPIGKNLMNLIVWGAIGYAAYQYLKKS